MPILGVIASSTRQGLVTDTGSMFALSSIIVPSAGTSTITFSNIPSTYTHLQIRGIGRNSASGTGALETYMRFNSDTGANYVAYHQIAGDGTNASAAASTGQTSIAPFYFVRDGNTANVFGSVIIDILDYTNTNKNKVIRTINGWNTNGSGLIYLKSGMWLNTTAINTITFTVEGGHNFVANSQFSLYGIKGA
jgi:hypothetical protein